MTDTVRIIVTTPQQEPRTFEFDSGTEHITIGRSDLRELRLDDSKVSRQHAEIWRDVSGRYHVRDLGSRNGTFANGDPITDYILTRGDQIGIGDFTLEVAVPSPLETRHSTRIVFDGDSPARLSTLRDFEAPRIDVNHLMKLNEFSKTLATTPNPADRLAAICALMVGDQFRGQWSVVVRLHSDRNTDTAPILLSEAHGHHSTLEPHLSKSVLRRVRETGEAILARNVGGPDAAQLNIDASISPQVLAMSAVACPLAQNDTEIDVLYILLPPTLGGAEWLALVNLAIKQLQQSEFMWSARRQAEQMAVVETELLRAREIQMRLIPKKLHFPGVDLGIGFIPCKAVGGDYVDALQLRDGRLLLTVADVCGKGLGAALIASSLRTMVHASVLGGLPLKRFMSNLNQYLCETLAADSFVTMIAALFDPATGNLEIVNAGHPAPLAIRSEKSVRELLVNHGMPLGIEDQEIYSGMHHIDVGETIAFFSDGLIEQRLRDDSMLGIKRLASELKNLCSNVNDPLEAISLQLTARLNNFKGSRPADDDWTFLLARRKQLPGTQ